MDISKRIQGIVETIDARTIVDIGTDHCYIPIWGLKKQCIAYAVACDVNPGPLQRAKENVAAMGLADKIELRLSDGFEKVAPGEGECAVIAGMGGGLMCRILNNFKPTTRSFQQLVLQPQSHIPDVRRAVHQLGFQIRGESMLFELNQYYCIIDCIKGEDVVYSEKEYLLGKKLMEHRENTYLDYIRHSYSKSTSILKNIAESGNKSPEALQRMRELSAMVQLYQEVLNNEP